MNSTAKPPRSYWIIAVVALLWMLIGVLAWFMDLLMSEAALAQMSEAQRQLYLTRPQWIFIVYAIAIFAGLLGAIGLFVRRSWATPAFGVSLVAVVVQFAYTFWVMDAIRLLGAAQVVPFPLVIFAIGAFLLWFSRRAGQRGYLV